MVQDYRAQHVLAVVPFSRHSGFAIDALVELFRRASLPLLRTDGRLSICFADTAPDTAVDSLDGFPWLAQPPQNGVAEYFRRLRKQEVDFVLGLDFPATSAIYGPARRAGVRTIVSYLGAPSSSINSGLKLWLKRREVALAKHGPDHHVFETEAMRDTGVFGRGIPMQATSVVPLGVDTNRFRPDAADASYVTHELGIPEGRKIVFYSGHFEERKGVAVLMRAAKHITEQRGRRDIHFLLLGNKGDEADRFRAQIAGSPAEEFVTFAGYRSDLDRLHRSCVAGVLPSTGWDSMTMSSVEMQSSGLPLCVSRLQGLPETIEEGVTGFTFTPDDEVDFIDKLCSLVDDEPRRAEFALRARRRAVKHFSREKQVSSLTCVLDQTLRRTFLSCR